MQGPVNIEERFHPACFDAYPTIKVPDLEATVDFYVKQLSFQMRFTWGEPPTHAGLQFGESTIHFSKWSDAEDIAKGFWLYFHVEEVDELFEYYQARHVNLLDEPTTQVWGMREFNLLDLNGVQLRFGQSDLRFGDPVPVKRVDLDVRIESRLANLLNDLAEHKSLTLAETLEETLLHSFEAIAGQEGKGVASPHTRRTLEFIAALKTKYGIDYDTHDSYRFTEGE